ncbi:MAG TPA: DUF131 domain-containing protein [Candidatus Desulfaltia sp.]|nr:DUF131 domain-containing protein [Candidatus Desulfaltia sp.]
MVVSGGFLALGLTMTVIGAIMVYLSLRARPSEAQSKGVGVIFIGPIPLVIGGSRKWVLAALGVAAVIMVVMIARAAEPNLIGW